MNFEEQERMWNMREHQIDKIYLTEAEMRAIAHLIGNALSSMPTNHPDYSILEVVREKIRVKFANPRKAE